MVSSGTYNASSHERSLVSEDKAGQRYWDELWANTPPPKAVHLRLHGWRNHVYRRFHALFRAAFADLNPHGRKLLEVGCARSAWLPYFAVEFGFDVYGLDYSEIGCRQAMWVLAKHGVRGRVVCADLFHPPAAMFGVFDVVFSMGVVEHFVHTSTCLAALARFLKTDGLMITIIPNMTGLTGLLLRCLNRPLFEKHTVLDAAALRQAHEQAGLDVLSCDYFMFTNFGVVRNLSGIAPGSGEYVVKNAAMILLHALSAAVWLIEESIGPLPAHSFTSPFIYCLARVRG